ncbi:FIG152265: Sodium:solute symporter associated protein [hydrothermal vent metagenome]|uniref:FIG152265: Sodium:solute symporter associated protein n=1 Tax=hydrothermal vent metagenome TaxID=652676 RepID=A0A1W1CVF4_9ZZZZ
MDKNQYWYKNIILITKCLSIWFIVSYLFSIVFVDVLNQIHFFGYKLGFWFAQQGSIYVFVILIFYYNNQINKIDEQYKK